MWSGNERRSDPPQGDRNLTDKDISAIVDALSNLSNGHTCRFSNVKDGDLGAAVEFYKAKSERFDAAITFYERLNDVLCDSKSVARKTLIVIVITAAAGATVVGFLDKIKKSITG